MTAPIKESGLPGPPRHALQRGDLAEKLVPRLRGASEQHRAGGGVGNNSALGTDLAALTDAQMPRHRRLTADLHEVLEDRGPRDANLRHDDTAAPEPDIVADLDQIIDP